MLTKILFKKSAAKSAGQAKSLSGKVILSESVLGKVSGARGGGGFIVPEKDKEKEKV